tara:strand:- start:3028 stop:3249 length:222 start_codon:yes stop_codon:yes gene_type:complete
MAIVDMDIAVIEGIIIGACFLLGLFAVIKIIEGWHFSNQVGKHLNSDASKANLVLPGSLIPNSRLPSLPRYSV